MRGLAVLITIKSGVCQGELHKVGDTFTVGETTPAGMCWGAWDAIMPYVTTLKYGGDFPWAKQKGAANIHCPDPEGITLEIRRIDD